MSRKRNHLRDETSPYLLQHVHNPVDWYPWGPEALARARDERKPIFLSVGYAACHWCHVMERESFEDAGIAAYLNEHFVSIKVDREERPDIDEIYMTAVQLMTGQGGWPMTVFLTPDLEPFFGGTYFPPESRWGRIGFLDLLQRIRDAWDSRRDEIASSAAEMVKAIRRVSSGDPGPGALPGASEEDRAAQELAARRDPDGGGFGSAPKFPPDQAIAFLLRRHAASGDDDALAMAVDTLDAMARGGLYDHVGGGFARYSVDDRWLVPHFEKMLYNQALLVPSYVDAWLVTGRDDHRRVVFETLDFVRREMTHPDGGLYSSLDADSEGVEGAFYVWTPDEVDRVLGEGDGERFRDAYDVTARGNFEGRSIPNRLSRPRGSDDPAVLAAERARLLAARGERVRPGTDDKILAAWNGLAITAFCRAAQVFGRPEDVASARAAASFVLGRMRHEGRLRATWREGVARHDAYLDDHAFLARGLVDLYETTFEPRFLHEAAALADVLLARFEDTARGGFFFVSDDHERLIARTRTFHDGALPSGNAVAAETLSRLSRHLERDRYREAARRTLAASAPSLARSPSSHAATLVAATWESPRVREVAIVAGGDDDGRDRLLGVVRHRTSPPTVVAADGADGAADLPLLRSRAAGPGARAWVCREGACEAPVDDPDALREGLDRVG